MKTILLIKMKKCCSVNDEQKTHGHIIVPNGHEYAKINFDKIVYKFAKVTDGKQKLKCHYSLPVTDQDLYAIISGFSFFPKT